MAEPRTSLRPPSAGADPGVGQMSRRRLIAVVLTVAGAALLVAAAFAPQRTASGDTLWREGGGWACAAAALILLALTRRALQRGTWSWAGLWIGALGLLNALALAADRAHVFGTGGKLLGLAGLVTLAGWAIGFLVVRPVVAGLGPWRALPRLLRTVGSPARRQAAERRPIGLRSPVVWSLLGYGLVSLALWGLPVADGFRTTLIAQNDIDPSVYTWFYGWWPHALLHGHNPLLSHAIFAPEGYNLTWVTAVPGPSLLATPLTLALGPVATYNLLALAAAPICAWSAFLLCRHLTRATAPSLVAGYVFGFSPYMLRMLQGSPHLYFVALVPLLVLVVVRRLEGSLGERTAFVAFAVGVAVQFMTSNDVLATMTIFGAIALALAFRFDVARRALILRTAGVLAAAYAAAAVLVSPIIWYMLSHEHTTPAQNTPLFANDLVSWVLPDSSLLLADSHRPDGTPTQYGGLAYYGVPLLLLAGLAAWSLRRERFVRIAALSFAAAAVLGLGQRLRIDNHITQIGLPWSAVDHLPGLELLVPQRFPLYAFLAAAVLIATWLARTPSASRWALALVVVASILPWAWDDYWKTPARNPPFFADGTYRSYLRSHDHVLAVPVIGRSMRWQSESGFRFELSGGGVGAFPESYDRYPIFGRLIAGDAGPQDLSRLREFVTAKQVTAVVLEKAAINPSIRRLVDGLGARPVDTGGVLVYRLRAPGA